MPKKPPAESGSSSVPYTGVGSRPSLNPKKNSVTYHNGKGTPIPNRASTIIAHDGKSFWRT